jgi:hypothetical protein
VTLQSVSHGRSIAMWVSYDLRDPQMRIRTDSVKFGQPSSKKWAPYMAIDICI